MEKKGYYYIEKIEDLIYAVNASRKLEANLKTELKDKWYESDLSYDTTVDIIISRFDEYNYRYKLDPVRIPFDKNDKFKLIGKTIRRINKNSIFLILSIDFEKVKIYDREISFENLSKNYVFVDENGDESPCNKEETYD